MATTDQDSRGDSRLAGQQDGSIWLDGDVLACACPDCGAPMSIRLWLLLADCLRCGASVELTEEQQQAARRLLEAKQETRWAETREAAAAIRPTAARRQTPKPAAPAAPETRGSQAAAGVASLAGAAQSGARRHGAPRRSRPDSPSLRAGLRRRRPGRSRPQSAGLAREPRLSHGGHPAPGPLDGVDRRSRRWASSCRPR